MIQKILLGLSVLGFGFLAMAEPTPPPPAYPGSYYDWAQAVDGFGYCYQFTPYGHVMWQGRPMGNYNCERVRPSYYRWAIANDGRTYCFQFTPYGHVLNDGRPVPGNYCGY